MSKYYFSTKYKIKKILLWIFVVLMVLALGYGIYYYFTHREENLTKKYLNGTKYEFLNRFYEKDDGEKFTYVVKGIVYNAKQNDSEVIFDINAWDLKTRESLYFSDISLGNVKMEDIDIEDVMYDFKPVSILFEFEKKKLVNVEVNTLELSASEYLSVKTNIFKFLTNDYSTVVKEANYSPSLSANILDKGGEIDVKPVYVNADSLTALYGIIQSKGENEFNQDKYIDDVIYRLKQSDLKPSIIMGGCSLVQRIKQTGKFTDSQITKLRDAFCLQQGFMSMSASKDASRWEELIAFVDSEKLDVTYQPDVEFVGLISLADFYTMVSLYGKVLTQSEITSVENRIVNSVITSGKDFTTYALPYETVCSVAYSLVSIPQYEKIERYSSLFSKLERTLSSYDNNEELVKLMERDTESTLICAEAFKQSNNSRINHLFSSALVKMYHLNIYKNGEYTGLWSILPEYKIMSIENNVRYFNLLDGEYAKE